MQRHRFREQLAKEEMVRRQQEQLPRGFMPCPIALPPGWTGPTNPWEEVYRLLFASKQGLDRHSRQEVDGDQTN